MLPSHSLPGAITARLRLIRNTGLSRLLREAMLVLLIGAGLAGCGGGGGASSLSASASPTPSVPAGSAPDTVAGSTGGTTVAAEPAMSPAAAIGRQIFRDTSLSASGRLACASCHNPDNAHAQSNDLAAQLGGADMMQQGMRAAPSLRYMNLTPRFTLAADGSPSGGFDRDGRAQTLADQAQRPFLSAHEMANADGAAVIARLRQAAYAEQFRAVFGAGILDDAPTAFARVLLSLQQYQNEDPAFHPYDSKYDQFIAGKVLLDPAELRGLALFNNPTKGNCAACHISAKGADGSAPQFTDFSYDNLGVPRNPALLANSDPAYFDLGLCGPDRTDLAARRDLCGAFKVPTLRNVATRHVFFHNGRFSSLKDVVSFYVRRDTNPEEWYPVAADGSVQKFDDLPPALRGNVNITEVPYNRKPGETPALTAAEIDDVVRFLGTLNDGYRAP